MIFFSFAELKREIEDYRKQGKKLTAEYLKELFSQKIGGADLLAVSERNVTPQELFFLLDQYEVEENRVFSDWVLTDQTLLSFLRDQELPGNTEVQKHEGHFLQEKYHLFVAQFLYPKLIERTQNAIKDEDQYSLTQLSELKHLLPEESKLKVDNLIDGYIQSIINDAKSNKKRAKEKLLQSGSVLLLNSLGEHFYPSKVQFVDSLKDIIEKEQDLSQKAIIAVKRVNLHDAHKKEVLSFLSGLSNTYRKGGVSAPKLLRTPLFYLGLLIVALLVYILLPKSMVKPVQTSGLPLNRTGLDSLSLDEIKSADSLLGYKSYSIITDNEEFRSVPLIDQYQMIDGEDTLKNDLARALSISMAADYKIQKDQGDSQNCSPLSMGERKGFQMEGVKNIEVLPKGFAHRMKNSSAYDLYILLFENEVGGNVYGSFIPSKGEVKFELNKGLRLVVYSGKDFTKFNPLQHKNGGYGSVVYAKQIDDRFIAHFCTLNQYNLQLMSKSWRAVKHGEETVVKAENGPIQLVSKAFEE